MRVKTQCNPKRRTWPRCHLVGAIAITIEPIFPILPSASITMPRFRRPKSLTTTPPSPAEVQKLTSKRKSKSLVASSTAIALSIGSPSLDTGDASSDGATVRARDMYWQTAYAAVRMAVEVAKESADLCPPPVQAVVGALSALIANYDVSVSFVN